MFTCVKIRNGCSYLEGHLVANDYYNENEKVTGKWIGKGAAELGIIGNQIHEKDQAFESLQKNQFLDGSGKQLTPKDAPSKT